MHGGFMANQLLNELKLDSRMLICPDFFPKHIWDRISDTSKFFIMEEEYANRALSD